MSFLSALPGDAALLQVFQAYPEPTKPLLLLHEQIMRAPSPFSAAERELIAAYVSGLNGCSYCHGVHTATAEAFGVEPDVLAGALADLDTAPVDERMKPVLRYLAKLTRTPARMTLADADEVFAAGWDDHALHNAVSVCALFNFMNRLVDGLGVQADASYHRTSGVRLHKRGYAGLAALLDA